MDQQMLISHLNDNVGSPNGYVCRIRCGQLMELPAITPKPTIQNFIDRACNPQSVEPDLALNLEIADLINQKKQNYPRDAAMHIVRLVNHRNPTVAWLALTVFIIYVFIIVDIVNIRSKWENMGSPNTIITSGPEAISFASFPVTMKSAVPLGTIRSENVTVSKGSYLLQ
ncbi:6473_t:CDS:2 [Entrophospora sp. SA101]|nr:6473_t:CDS:2 [Entrophospora sp. SA101]